MKIPNFKKKSINSNNETQIPERYLFKLDEPRSTQVHDRKMVVRGWVLPLNGSKVNAMRLRNGTNLYDIVYGLERRDILQVYAEVGEDKALKSGFEVKFELDDSDIVIEVDLGDGYEIIEKITLQYVGDKPLSENYNPHLASNWAEHINLQKSQKSYFYENAVSGDIKLGKEDPKVIAFYLPQFHPIPENDRTWGKGFTEWTNVASAQPRYIGHNQPILPGDLGFYDLRLEDNIKDQIDLAKSHGIYGFCLYYYWFSGDKILDKPIKSIMKHKEWDFNFMICWANENWTKRWDGHDNDVIIAQKYLEDDAINFIKEVEHILLDPRYIRHEGKPILSVYRPEKLKEPANFSKVWQDYFKEKHDIEIHLVSVMGFENQDPKLYGFQTAIDFVPLSIDFKSEHFPEHVVPQVSISERLLDVKHEGAVYDYRRIVLNQEYQTATYDFHTYKSVMPSWDNDARKKGKGSSFYFNNPDLYAQWLDNALSNREHSSDPVFVNAWNEWAEGAMLEPTQHFGHAMLNRTAEIIAKHSISKANKAAFPIYGYERNKNTTTAVVVHLFYTDQWEYIHEKLGNMGSIPFDLFVTLQTKDEEFSDEILKYNKNTHIDIIENRGRDILPFIVTARRLDQKGYTSILKIHTKKSKHRNDGDKWFKQLVNGLLPSEEAVSATKKILDNEIALIGPKGHYVSFKEYIGSNKPSIDQMLKRMYSDSNFNTIERKIGEYGYFGGSMFWVSTEAIRPLLKQHLMSEDFEVEAGQIDGTLAHAIERLIGLVASEQGAKMYKITKKGITPIKESEQSSDYKFAK
jgi:lipopolysaccharide biosynthesis protein